MTDTRRALLRKLENVEAFPLIALQALPELRADLDAVEAEALLRARELGASLEDIAEALAITRQGVAYKLKALAGNDDDHEESAEEPQQTEAQVAEVEVPKVVEEAPQVDVVELPDEAEEPQVDQPDEPEIIDVRAPETDVQRPEVDFRRPHTKA
jgi:hypothetical protein